MPSYEEESPALVRNLVPAPAPEKIANTKPSKKKVKTEEERRKMLELLDEENDLDYYSESDDDYQTYV